MFHVKHEADRFRVPAAPAQGEQPPHEPCHATDSAAFVSATVVLEGAP